MSASALLGAVVVLVSPFEVPLRGAMEPPPRSEGPVGGYWAPGERPQSEPPDGYWKIVTGSILVPLGIIGTGAAIAGAVVTSEPHCQDFTSLDPDECRGLFAFSLVRVAYSGLMLVSGAVILAIGLSERKRHREWEKRRHLTISPSFRPGRGSTSTGLVLTVRFGP